MYAMSLRQKGIYDFLAEVNEERLVRDLACYEQQLASIGAPANEHERGLQNNYRTLLRYGRKLLAAVRDGRPDQWIDYPD
jgi:hypothetical protein